MKNKFKYWLSLLSIGYLVGMVILAFAEIWPEALWWAANLFEILPLWILIFPATGLIILTILTDLKRESIFNFISMVVILVFIMGFNLPISFQPRGNSKDSFQLRVMAVNVGDNKGLEKLCTLIDNVKPDIIAIEEANAVKQEVIKSCLAYQKWDVEFDNQLGIASQLKIVGSEYKNRRVLNGWGTIVGKYSLEAPKGIVHFLTVHLETPRKGVEALIDEKFQGVAEMKRITHNQEAETLISLDLIKSSSPAIIAGDFNMLLTNPIFKKYWSSYRDVYSQKGFGFGYTKHTSWHGARIDHILVDSNWLVREARVGPDIGGDHRPVITDLEFVGEFNVIKDFVAIKQEKLPTQNSEHIFILEDFENSVGRFVGASNNELTLVKNVEGHSGRVLKIAPSTLAQELSVGFKIESWPIKQYPQVNFDYNISFSAPIGIAVETVLGDWICIGGVIGYQCPTVKSPSQFDLADDGKWHEATINIREAVHSLVAGVDQLKAMQFFIPANRHQGDNLYLDDIMITK